MWKGGKVPHLFNAMKRRESEKAGREGKGREGGRGSPTSSMLLWPLISSL